MTNSPNNQGNPEYSLTQDKFLLNAVQHGDEELGTLIDSTEQANKIAQSSPENPLFQIVAEAAQERLVAFVVKHGLATEVPLPEEPTDQT